MSLKLKDWLAAVAAALSFTACALVGSEESAMDELPNVVYILADDMGYGDVGCLNPQGKIPTPNMDRLGREGMIFTDAHSGSAVCTPTRYGVLTGRYSWRTSLKSGVYWGYSQPLIKEGRETVASLLKRHGYETACVGKWHLGLGWQALNSGADPSEKKSNTRPDYTKPILNGPVDLGFDCFFGIPASLDMVPYVYVENDRVVEAPTETITGLEGYEFYRGGPAAPGFRHEEVLPMCTKKAVAFIERHAEARPDSPFFLYFPLSAPHTPILPTGEFKGKTGIGPYADFVHQCDWTVGRIMEVLERLGMAENTLFIVTSDNGCSPMANFEHLEEQGHDPSYHFRGHKADIFEGGHRIPYIARWPARVEAGSTYGHTICLTDLMATAAAIVGADLADNAGEDSVSTLPALLGIAKGPVREATVHHSINGSFSIRQGRWKLELCPGSGGWSDPKPGNAVEEGLPMIQLYDLSRDVGERENVQARHPDVVYRMIRLLEDYVERGRSTPGAPQKNDGDPDIWPAQARLEKSKG
jgi:arylsulfatase A-like enzyme